MKILRFALLCAAALAVLLAAVLAYLAFTFDPGDYQPRIVQFVKDKTGRTLHLAREIELSFWPDIGVRLGPLSLSERHSEERFANVDDARFRIKLLPLLSGELIADELSVQGAHLRITRFEDGRFNVDDLFKSDGSESRMDVGRVSVRGSTVSYRDLGARTRYELSAITLETGRIAGGVVTPVVLTLLARDALQTFDLAGGLKGRLAYDLEQQTCTLHDAVLEVSGRMLGVTDLVARVRGSVGVRVREGELTTTPLVAAVKGTVRGEKWDVQAEASNVAIAAARALGDSVNVDAQATGVAGTIALKLAASRLERDSNVFKSEAVTLDLDMQRAGYALKAAVDSPLEARLAERTLALMNVKSSFRVTGARLPGKGITGTVMGDASLNWTKQAAQLKLAGKVANSQITARLASAGFDNPVYTFAVDIDQLDIDRYADGDKREQAGKASGLDLSPLAALPASGTLHIGVLTAAGMKASNVNLVLKP